MLHHHAFFSKKKKILFIGPSKVALEDFDWAILNDYDYIARTNMFLENRNLSKKHNRCEIIYLNVHCCNMYLNISQRRLYRLTTSKLKNMIVLVKFNSFIPPLMKLVGRKRSLMANKCNLCLSTVHVRNSINEQLSGMEPKGQGQNMECYSGTSLIVYLAKFCNQLDVCGLDFYQSGFGLNAKYVEGYNAYNNASDKEEPRHNMQKDIRFLREFLSRNKHVNFIHKTKTIFQELS